MCCTLKAIVFNVITDAAFRRRRVFNPRINTRPGALDFVSERWTQRGSDGMRRVCGGGGAGSGLGAGAGLGEGRREGGEGSHAATE